MYYRVANSASLQGRHISHRSVLEETLDTSKSRRKWSRSVVSESLGSHGLQPPTLLCPWDFPGNSTGVGCHFLLQARVLEWVARIFPNSGIEPGSPALQADALPSKPLPKSWGPSCCALVPVWTWGARNGRWGQELEWSCEVVRSHQPEKGSSERSVLMLQIETALPRGGAR